MKKINKLFFLSTAFLLSTSNIYASQFYRNVSSLARADNVTEVVGFVNEKNNKNNNKEKHITLIKEHINKKIKQNKKDPDYIIGLKKITDIYYPVNSYCLYKKEYLDNLEKLTKEMKQKKYPTLFIIGTASPEGNENYNNKLAYKRAESVKKVLLKYGYPKNKIEIAYKIYKNVSNKKEYPKLRKAIIYTVDR